MSSSPCPFIDYAKPDLFSDTVSDSAISVSCLATETHEVCYSREEYDRKNHGRRPKGYASPDVSTTLSVVGRYLALCAHLEAASVIAFDVLRGELEHHGFPHGVLDACTRAGREEVAHAYVIGKLAVRFGAGVPPLDIERLGGGHGLAAPRALVDIAIENAVEGCVGEVFGAAEALFRARRADDDGMRAALDRIAVDETGHAELSLQLAALLDSHLDDDERRRVRSALDAARPALRSSLERRETHEALVFVAGVPRRREALALFEALDAAIWSRCPTPAPFSPIAA